MDALEVQSCQAAVFEEEGAVYIHCCEVFYEVSITVTSLQCLRLNAVFVHISFLNSPSVTNNTLLHAWFLFKCSIVCPNITMFHCFMLDCLLKICIRRFKDLEHYLFLVYKIIGTLYKVCTLIDVHEQCFIFVFAQNMSYII